MKYIQLNEIIKDSELDELFEKLEVIEGVFEYRPKLISSQQVAYPYSTGVIYEFVIECGFNNRWKSIALIEAFANFKNGGQFTCKHKLYSETVYVNGIEVPIIKHRK